jgi:hypothetical protein
LDDVPQRTIKRLREDDYIICTKAAWGWMYDLYPYEESLYLQIAKRCGFLRFLSEFFVRCNGRLTLREIAQNLSEYLNISLTKSLRFCAIITIVLAQLGVIRSALFDTEIELELKRIAIPNYFRTKWKYRILCLFAKVLRL